MLKPKIFRSTCNITNYITHYEIMKNGLETKQTGASSCEKGTYHIGEQRRCRPAAYHTQYGTIPCIRCNAHSMFLLFPENRKSIPQFFSGKNLLKNVTLQISFFYLQLTKHFSYGVMSLFSLHCYILRINITLYGEKLYLSTYIKKTTLELTYHYMEKKFIC